MARTPSMTPHEAESILGPRGNLTVTAENRATVKKWLSAKGLPAVAAACMPYKGMQHCYNDTTDRTLESYLARAAEDKDEENAIVAAETAAIESAKVAPTANDGSAGATLANLVAPYLVDSVASTVNELMAECERKVDEKLASVQITRIEVKRADNTVHVVEGHQHPTFAKLLRYMSARQANGFYPNIMIVGPTGSGKTHAVAMACKALGIGFFTNGAISMDHQLIGFRDAHGNYHDTPLRQAFACAAGYLFDEIDSSDNPPLLCLAGLLANGGFNFPDAYVERHPDSRIIAAANTFGLGATAEFVGRNKLDGAIRSRFPIRLFWDYDEKLELAIAGNEAWTRRVQKARANARKAGLKVTIDPRMSQAGAAMIAAGATFEEAAQDTYLADLSPEQRRQVDAD